MTTLTLSISAPQLSFRPASLICRVSMPSAPMTSIDAACQTVEVGSKAPTGLPFHQISNLSVSP